MSHKVCTTCSHMDEAFSGVPCTECNSNDMPVHARRCLHKDEQGAGDKWEPNAPAQSLIAVGRRNGLEEAYKIASEQSVLALRMKLEEALEAK